jgi:hypothetical protein
LAADGRDQVDLCAPDKLELGRHLWSHLETAGADSRSNRDQQILRLGAEPLCQRFHNSGRYFRHYTPPTGVDRSNHAVSGIGHQDGEAIGGSNRQTDPWLIRNECVPFALRSARFDHQDVVGMHLRGGSQPVTSRPSFSRTSFRRPSIAQAGPKTVPEPGQAIQGLGPVNVIAVKAKQVPV